MMIIWTPHPDVPGVEFLTWVDGTGQRDRCVLARAGPTDHCWMQSADLVICRPQPSRVAAYGQALEVLAGLPGSSVAAAGWDQHCTVLVRGGGEFSFCAPGQDRSGWPVDACAVWCYSLTVASGPSLVSAWTRVSRRVCTCRAWGS
jgi:hypothetical protein